MSRPGGWINIKMSSYQYRKSHCGDKTILRPSYLHNGISYTGKTTSLYWIGAQFTIMPLADVPVPICHQALRNHHADASAITYYNNSRPLNKQCSRVVGRSATRKFPCYWWAHLLTEMVLCVANARCTYGLGAALINHLLSYRSISQRERLMDTKLDPWYQFPFPET